MTTTATDPAVDPTPAAVRAPSPRRRRRLAATALWVPLVLGLGVWLVVGMRPDLSSGYAEGPGPGGRYTLPPPIGACPGGGLPPPICPGGPAGWRPGGGPVGATCPGGVPPGD